MTHATAITLVILAVLLILSNTLNNKEQITKSNWNPFECGFQEMSENRLPFSTQFFLTAILFLIFDVEISLVIPFSVESNTPQSNLIIIIFLSILAVGLAYEWNYKKLEWSE